MKKIALLAVLTLVLSASAASAQYIGAWDYTWNFETGTQNWVLATNGAGVPTWIDPADTDGPNLPDGAASGAGGGNLWLADGSYARLDVSSLGLGANGTMFSNKKGFILQADVYIPNLRPLSGFNYGYPGNMNHKAGIGAEGSHIEVYCEGNIDRGGITVRDFSWDSTAHCRNWCMESTAPNAEWWDQWITLQIDYGYTTAGKYTAYAYIPWDSYVGTAGWVALIDGSYEVCPNGSAVDLIQLGGMYSWTQAQFDNVSLAVAPVPELGSMAALASGLVGLAGFGIRRR